jgi:hypothetical protein
MLLMWRPWHRAEELQAHLPFVKGGALTVTHRVNLYGIYCVCCDMMFADEA